MESNNNIRQEIAQQDELCWIIFLPSELLIQIIMICINMTNHEEKLGRVLASLLRTNKLFNDLINQESIILNCVLDKFNDIKQQFFVKQNIRYEGIPKELLTINNDEITLFSKIKLLEKIKYFSENKDVFVKEIKTLKGGPLLIAPLENAAFNGDLDLVLLSIYNGADVKQKGHFALLKAAVNGHIEIVKVLLENGAQINKKGIYGATPLTLAAANGYDDIVKLLIEKKAYVNVQNYFGNTALMLASYYGYRATVELLCENGADIFAMNNEFQTAYDLAVSAEKFEIAEFI